MNLSENAKHCLLLIVASLLFILLASGAVPTTGTPAVTTIIAPG